MKIKQLFVNINKPVFFLCLFLTIILMVVSFLIPPTGVIDGSVIAASGELFGFAALATVISAIGKGKSVSVSKGDTSITIDDENNN